MTIPNVTPYPGDLPDIDDPVTFNSRMDAFAAWFDAVVIEIEATVSGMNTALNDNGTVLDASADSTQRVVNATEPTLSTGSATAYTLSAASTITAYADGQTFLVRVHTQSGTAPTLAIDGLAALPIQIRDDAGTLAAISDGLMRANELFLFTVENGATVFEITSQPIKEVTDIIAHRFIERQAASGGTVSFTNLDNTDYDEHYFVLKNVSSDSSFDNIHMEVSFDGGSTWETSGYYWGQESFEAGAGIAAPTVNGADNGAEFRVTNIAGGITTGNGHLKVIGNSVQSEFRFVVLGSGSRQVLRTSGEMSTVSDISAVRFICDGGNFDGGFITQFGLRNS